MLDIKTLLEDIKKAPYRELTVFAPHSGNIEFVLKDVGTKVKGVSGTWKEKPGTLLAYLVREGNKKPLYAPEKGDVVEFCGLKDGQFVQAGTPLNSPCRLSRERAIRFSREASLSSRPAWDCLSRSTDRRRLLIFVSWSSVVLLIWDSHWCRCRSSTCCCWVVTHPVRPRREKETITIAFLIRTQRLALASGRPAIQGTPRLHRSGCRFIAAVPALGVKSRSRELARVSPGRLN